MANNNLWKFAGLALAAGGLYYLLRPPKQTGETAWGVDDYYGDAGQESCGQIGSERVYTGTGNLPGGGQLGQVVRDDASGAEYREIYANPPLEALFNWLDKNSSIKLKLELRDHETERRFRNAPSGFEELYNAGAAWNIEPLLITSVKATDQPFFRQQAAEHAMKTGGIYAITAEDGYSNWYIWKNGLQTQVPLEEFGFVSAAGPDASLIAFVGDMSEFAQGGQSSSSSSGSGVGDAVGGALTGLASDLGESLLDEGTSYLSDTFSEGIGSLFSDD